MNENIPQLEDGYTMIANGLIEAICRLRITTSEHLVIWAIIRKTYGYKRKKDCIALSQISLLTGLYKSHVSRTIRLLLARLIVTRSGNSIGINKDIGVWKNKLPEEVKVTQWGSKVTSLGNKKLPDQAPQNKEINYTKERGFKKYKTYYI